MRRAKIYNVYIHTYIIYTYTHTCIHAYSEVIVITIK